MTTTEATTVYLRNLDTAITDINHKAVFHGHFIQGTEGGVVRCPLSVRTL